MVQTKIDLDGDTHRKLKAEAAMKGLTLREYIQQILRGQVDEHKG